MSKRKKHRKHEYTPSAQNDPSVETVQIATVLPMIAIWLGGVWYYANGSWGLGIFLAIVSMPFMYMFAPIFAAIGLIITIIIESLSHKLAAARKVQHINTSRPYDLAEIRQKARQAAGLSDEA